MLNFFTSSFVEKITLNPKNTKRFIKLLATCRNKQVEMDLSANNVNFEDVNNIYLMIILSIYIPF